jgi:serine/threonine protein kinase
LIIELIMIDIELRWRAWSARRSGHKAEGTWADAPTCDSAEAKPPFLFDYAAQFPELGEPGCVPDQLIANEYRVRWHYGDRPSRQEYLERYTQRPSLAALLQRVEAQFDQALLDTATIQEGDSRPATPARRQHQNHPLATLAFDGSVTVGSRIGPYKLLEQLGEGGMGSVWLAEQLAPVRRTVALKLIRRGMDYGQVLARFEAERQALALMEHPNIAKVLDAGATSTGQPFFVMELVKGVPITSYCDDNRLSINERLDLFNTVCQAIQHAHQKGIIHRDIKPSNVLVAIYDGKPVAKVIDFGLAKATGIKLTDDTLHTAMGQVLGTLEYMSPEQAEVGQLDIDTRSDIYSLGVLLYELLTGTTPLVRSTLRNALLVDVLRRIQEEESPRPSVRVTRDTEEPDRIAERRNTAPVQLPRLLAADLDWIALKALEKDRNRRYETANAFARDIERHLQDEPVQARPPSAKYRIGKFVRKHRLAVTAAATVAVVLLVATGVSMGLALWALNERSRAVAAEGDAQFQLSEAINARNAEKKAAGEASESNADTQAYATFLVDHVLASARPEGKDGGLGVNVSVRQALDVAEKKVDEVFRGRPRAERIVRQGLGHTWFRLGEPKSAVQDLERARELTLSQFGAQHAETLTSAHNLANAYIDAGRESEAIPLLEEAIKRRRITLGRVHPDTVSSVNSLANAYVSRGQFTLAIEILEENLKLIRAAHGPDHPYALGTMNNLASIYRYAGGSSKALPLLEEALKLRRGKLGPDHPDTLTVMVNVGEAYRAAGELVKAVAILDETVTLMRAKLGPEHLDTLQSMNSLASAYTDAGDLAKAISLNEEALRLRRTKLGYDHPDTLQSMNGLGNAYRRAGDLAKAIPILEETVALIRPKLGSDHPYALFSMNNLAIAYRDAGNSAKAIPLLEETVTLMRTKLGSDNPYTIASMNNLAKAYLASGNVPKAIEIFGEAVKLRALKLSKQEIKSGGPVKEQLKQGNLTNYEAKKPSVDSGNINPAERQLVEISKRLKVKPDDAELLAARVELLACAGKLEAAIEDLRSLIRLQPDDHFRYYTLLTLLAATGQSAEYRKMGETMAARFKDPPVANLEILERTAKGCLFWGASGTDWNKVAPLGDRVLERVLANNHWVVSYAKVAKGLADYRRGNYKSAIDYVTEVAEKNTKIHNLAVPGYCVKAMAHARLGEITKAKAALELAHKSQASVAPPAKAGPGSGWHDWHICDVMIREAQAVVLEKSASKTAAVPP